jgi:hypothetical protein
VDDTEGLRACTGFGKEITFFFFVFESKSNGVVHTSCDWDGIDLSNGIIERSKLNLGRRMADQNDLDEDEELTLHESSVRVCVVRALALERERDRVVVVWWCWPAMGRGCGLEYGLKLVLLVVERGIR